MASEILGLFASPELYQQQQDALAREQAAQYAAMNPYEQVTFNAALAGRQFGRALGGLLGGEDPQLKIIGARQRVMQNINPSNPDAILQAAQQLANIGDQQGALTLADYARKAQSELALTQQRLRERDAAGGSKALADATARAELQDRIAQMEALPQSPERDRALAIAKNILKNLFAKPEGLVREQQIARDLALAKGPEGSDAYKTEYDKSLRELTSKGEQAKLGEFERVLNARYPDTPENATKRAELMDQYLLSEITGRGKGKGTEVELKLPGQGKEGAKDIPAFRDKVINTIDPFRKTVTAADSAIANLEDSLKNNNFASFRAAQTQFARAIAGAGDLSQKELKAAGADPSFVGGGVDYLSTLLTSTPSEDTQKKLLSAAKVLRKVAVNKAQNEIATQKKIATRAGFTKDDTDLIFDFPEFQGTPAPATGGAKQTTRTLKSGKVVTIIED